jgi:hypothetical protein
MGLVVSDLAVGLRQFFGFFAAKTYVNTQKVKKTGKRPAKDRGFIRQNGL